MKHGGVWDTLGRTCNALLLIGGGAAMGWWFVVTTQAAQIIREGCAR